MQTQSLPPVFMSLGEFTFCVSSSSRGFRFNICLPVHRIIGDQRDVLDGNLWVHRVSVGNLIGQLESIDSYEIWFLTVIIELCNSTKPFPAFHDYIFTVGVCNIQAPYSPPTVVLKYSVFVPIVPVTWLSEASTLEAPQSHNSVDSTSSKLLFDEAGGVGPQRTEVGKI